MRGRHSFGHGFDLQVKKDYIRKMGVGQMLTKDDKGGKGVSKKMTTSDEGGVSK